MLFVEEYAMLHGTFSFRRLLEHGSGKGYIIVTFLSVLEMMKTGKLRIVQENLFDDMTITYQKGQKKETERPGG